jgi:acetate kinase
MATVLGGLDFLAFTGGIGANDQAMREMILQKLKWIGEFETAALDAREEEMIQRHAAALLGLP